MNEFFNNLCRKYDYDSKDPILLGFYSALIFDEESRDYSGALLKVKELMETLTPKSSLSLSKKNSDSIIHAKRHFDEFKSSFPDYYQSIEKKINLLFFYMTEEFDDSFWGNLRSFSARLISSLYTEGFLQLSSNVCLIVPERTSNISFDAFCLSQQSKKLSYSLNGYIENRKSMLNELIELRYYNGDDEESPEVIRLKKALADVENIIPECLMKVSSVLSPEEYDENQFALFHLFSKDESQSTLLYLHDHLRTIVDHNIEGILEDDEVKSGDHDEVKSIDETKSGVEVRFADNELGRYFWDRKEAYILRAGTIEDNFFNDSDQIHIFKIVSYLLDVASLFKSIITNSCFTLDEIYFDPLSPDLIDEEAHTLSQSNKKIVEDSLRLLSFHAKEYISQFNSFPEHTDIVSQLFDMVFDTFEYNYNSYNSDGNIKTSIFQAFNCVYDNIASFLLAKSVLNATDTHNRYALLYNINFDDLSSYQKKRLSLNLYDLILSASDENMCLLINDFPELITLLLVEKIEAIFPVIYKASYHLAKIEAWEEFPLILALIKDYVLKIRDTDPYPLGPSDPLVLFSSIIAASGLNFHRELIIPSQRIKGLFKSPLKKSIRSIYESNIEPTWIFNLISFIATMGLINGYRDCDKAVFLFKDLGSAINEYVFSIVSHIENFLLTPRLNKFTQGSQFPAFLMGHIFNLFEQHPYYSEYLMIILKEFSFSANGSTQNIMLMNCLTQLEGLEDNDNYPSNLFISKIYSCKARLESDLGIGNEEESEGADEEEALEPVAPSTRAPRFQWSKEEKDEERDTDSFSLISGSLELGGCLKMLTFSPSHSEDSFEEKRDSFDELVADI